MHHIYEKDWNLPDIMFMEMVGESECLMSHVSKRQETVLTLTFCENGRTLTFFYIAVI